MKMTRSVLGDAITWGSYPLAQQLRAFAKGASSGRFREILRDRQVQCLPHIANEGIALRERSSDAEYRGAERMWLLTGGRSPLRYVLTIILGLIALTLRLTRERSPRDYSESRPPSITSAQDAPPVERQVRPGDDLLNIIRLQGYRVTVHELVGALEMRATPVSDPNRIIQSARVDRPAGSRDAEQRCARELAKKLGVDVATAP
jgi:hypothetical protein